ncbi:MAG: hypothetical protein RBR06_07180 [Desulfuromonadaceae bacterium]|nr:hypothetical protein [Desulfuromonadaceae bacterium]
MQPANRYGQAGEARKLVWKFHHIHASASETEATGHHDNRQLLHTILSDTTSDIGINRP